MAPDSQNPTENPENEDVSPDDVRDTSDDSLALRFTKEHRDTIRYCSQWNKWLIWNGAKWEHDLKMRVYRRSRAFVRNEALDIQRSLTKRIVDAIPFTADEVEKRTAKSDAKRKARKYTREVQSSGKVHNVVTLTRYDGCIATSVEEWDADPWLLNTPQGTINLRTGENREHNPKDYITRQTAVAPDFKTQPRLWLNFLKTIMHGDEEMLLYLQKVFGYCLVGSTKEHEMYFAYGTGANGKGVTINTIRGLLGEYGKEATIETFIMTQSDRHPTELADLRGARLVTCGETEQGQRWAEARIKMLTGGDPVKARFMRQDFFEYKPQFKLFLAGNHKPRLSHVDEAIERRFRLIPFTHFIPKPERDRDLGEKLQAEWPSILAWAIDGCLRWQAEGLDAPPAVQTATKSYLSQEDSLTSWYSECCEADPTSFVYVADLFASWRAWAQANGEALNTKRTLARSLEDREPILKITKARRNEGMGFMGLRLVTPAPKTND